MAWAMTEDKPRMRCVSMDVHWQDKKFNLKATSLLTNTGLGQGDLKNEIGSQGVVSEILNGKRQLNLSHIKKLALRFGVKPATFID